ncbi:MAG: 30S ribosomal protein S18 [Thermomicrobiales bacterium]
MRRFGRTGGRRREPIFKTAEDVDYKEIAQLRRCIDERGRILPRRRLNHSAEVQRAVAVAIKRARHCALLPFQM